MRRCPFCDAEIDLDFPHLTEFDDGTFVYNHFCGGVPNKLGVVITLYGDSREELVEKWDGVYYAKEQKDESL